MTVGYGYSTLAWIPEALLKLGLATVARENYQLGQSNFSGCSTIIECQFSLAVKSAIVVGQRIRLCAVCQSNRRIAGR